MAASDSDLELTAAPRYPRPEMPVSSVESRRPNMLRIKRLGIDTCHETVAFLVPRARLEALVETMEILGNPAAMKAIRQHEAGKLSFRPVSALDEDEG